MIEKVNPSHPDKVADRIAGALVDLCYTKSDRPKCAFEVLLGHGKAYIIAETSEHITYSEIDKIVRRIAGEGFITVYTEVPQDPELSKNQAETLRAGDNGIFKGVPVGKDIVRLSSIANDIYTAFPSDGKYILAGNRLIICQSNAKDKEILNIPAVSSFDTVINPLGYWTGGTEVDTGAVNRKLGSDMGEAVTGGGLHGKDLSKADVSVNIYAHLKAQDTGEVIELHCAIGDEYIDGVPYTKIVRVAADYIKFLGGFENLAEWGLV